MTASLVGDGCRACSRESLRGLLWCVGEGSGVATNSLKPCLVGDCCGVRMKLCISVGCESGPGLKLVHSGDAVREGMMVDSGAPLKGLLLLKAKVVWPGDGIGDDS
jgi:hypothetical protein